MYRIKLASGAEQTYHSIEEFAGALHDGTVTSEALIYHQRADRWLAVTNHPHYQIALSRGPSAPRSDASKRQVISAIRAPAEAPPTRVAPQVEVPPTVARPVAEAPRKLTIPAPKKPETSALRAQENVLEGVVVNRAESPKTTVLPRRSGEPEAVKAPVRAPEPKVPDLGEGLDLVEEVGADAAPKRPSVATPQVDKLLEMLAPESPPAPAPAKAAAPLRHGVEVLDLGAPLPRQTAPVPPPLFPPVVQAAAPVAPAPVQMSRGQNSKMIGLAAAAVIAIGAVMFVWKPWSSETLPEGTEIASTTLPRTEVFGGSTANPAPTTADISGSPSPAGADSSRSGSKPVDSAPAIVRVRAPRNIGVSVPTTNLIATSGGSGLTVSASELIQHYNVAYTEARSELELRMLQIGFTQIFLRTRLSSTSGVEDTRRLVASATSALRQYRNDETRIERSYQDTIGVAGRNLSWTPRDLGVWNMKAGQKESGETLRLTNLMLGQMDSVFSLLAEQEGKYRTSGDAITFDNSEAARQYGALRVWLNQQADKYAGSGDALPATLRQVVKAIGSTRLPQERR